MRASTSSMAASFGVGGSAASLTVERSTSSGGGAPSDSDTSCRVAWWVAEASLVAASAGEEASTGLKCETIRSLPCCSCWRTLLACALLNCSRAFSVCCRGNCLRDPFLHRRKPSSYFECRQACKTRPRETARSWPYSRHPAHTHSLCYLPLHKVSQGLLH